MKLGRIKFGMEKFTRELQTQINNHKVLESELNQLKPNAKVYKKQENSNIFFVSSREKEMSACKDTLVDLAKQYKECEKLMKES